MFSRSIPNKQTKKEFYSDLTSGSKRAKFFVFVHFKNYTKAFNVIITLVMINTSIVLWELLFTSQIYFLNSLPSALMRLEDGFVYLQ